MCFQNNQMNDLYNILQKVIMYSYDEFKYFFDNGLDVNYKLNIYGKTCTIISQVIKDDTDTIQKLKYLLEKNVIIYESDYEYLFDRYCYENDDEDESDIYETMRIIAKYKNNDPLILKYVNFRTYTHIINEFSIFNIFNNYRHLIHEIEYKSVQSDLLNRIYKYIEPIIIQEIQSATDFDQCVYVVTKWNKVYDDLFDHHEGYLERFSILYSM